MGMEIFAYKSDITCKILERIVIQKSILNLQQDIFILYALESINFSTLYDYKFILKNIPLYYKIQFLLHLFITLFIDDEYLYYR